MSDLNQPLIPPNVLSDVFDRNQDLPVMPEVGRQLISLKAQENVELLDLVVDDPFGDTKQLGSLFLNIIGFFQGFVMQSR